MARTRNPNSSEAQLTTAQQLGSIVKSCRDIMRKDKGLSGDLDRLPMLVWVMFLAGELRKRTASPETLSSPISARIRQCGPMAAKGRGSSPTCAACRVRTEAIGGM
jgi:hypothetical protein